MNLNDLSDDILLHIFAEFPLSKLLCFSIVCSRWTILTASALAQRDTLTLLIDERDAPFYPQMLIKKSPFNVGQDLLADGGVTPLKTLFQLSRSFLKLTGVNSKVIGNIKITFPKVRFFGISLHNKIRNDHMLIDLLNDEWARRLVSFSFWSNYPSSKLRSSLLKLCNSPTKLAALRHLTLDIGTFRFKPLKLSILSQLSSFNLASTNSLESILPTLADYQKMACKSSKPKCSIDLPFITDLEVCFESTLKNELIRVAPFFTRLSSKALSSYFYNHFAANFSSLAIVNVDTYSCESLSQLFLSLATLDKLTHLTMTLSTEMDSHCTTVNLPSLQSVRWLALRCAIADIELAKCPLQHLFPAVEYIKVRFSDRQANVFRAFTVPLGLPRLHTFKYRENGVYHRLNRDAFKKLVKQQEMLA